MQYPSVALFVQRARVFLPTFQLTPQVARAVAEICQHLDGLPLAIEFAASLLKVFSPPALAEQIVQQRFKILRNDRHSATVSHHAALYSAIKASYDLLTADEQMLFRHLAVFSGGCSLEAAETLQRFYTPRHVEIISIITSLIDKCLLVRNAQIEVFPSFTMLETVREFGRECLQEEGEWEESQEAYARYYLALLLEAEPHLKGKGLDAWLKRLEGEKENMRSALTGFIERGESEAMLQFCDVFGKFCGLRGYWSEEQQWLSTVLEQTRAVAPMPVRGKVLRRAGHLAYRFRELAKARAYFEESVALSRALNDGSNLAGALSGLAWVVYRQKDIPRARQLLQESLAIARGSGDTWSLANTLESFGRFALYQGLLDEAADLLEESIALARGVADKESLARILFTFVSIQLAQGESDLAEAAAWESYTLAQELANKPLIALALDGLADVAFFQEEYEEAASLYEQRILLALELDDRSTVASKRLRLGSIALKRGELDLANALVQESLLFFRSQQDNPNIALALCTLGECRWRQRDTRRALQVYRETLQLEHEIGRKENLGRCLIGLARLLRAQGQLSQAAYLLGFAQSCLGGPGKAVYLLLATDYRQLGEQIRSQLGHDLFTAAMARGEQMEYREILSFCG